MNGKVGHMSKPTKAKGSMFITFVKAIKADKTGTCEALLTDEDKEIVSKLILQASWYPFETYKNCFKAVCQVNAKNNPRVLREWGREAGEATMTTIYKTVLQQKDAETAIDAYQLIVKNQYDSGGIEKIKVSDNEIVFKLVDFDPDFEQWYHVCMGWIERTIELVINKEVRSTIVERSWEGAPATVFKMSWSS